MDIYFVNESTQLSERDAWNITWACDYQARFHYSRAGWRPDVRCHYLPGGGHAQIPGGGMVMHFLDTADQPGALGYHDEDGNEVPFGRVFVVTSQQANDPVSEVASHEVLELATDPHINDSCLTGDSKKLVAKEVGDPCQGNAYDVGEPEGRTLGISVADFVLPNYFDPSTAADAVTDFRGALKGPFVVGPHGYQSYVDLSNPGAGWQQTLGAERTSAPGSDDRLGRR